MSQNVPSKDAVRLANPVTPRAPYVPPTLEPLGRWSAITMVSGGGGGLIRKPDIRDILTR